MAVRKSKNIGKEIKGFLILDSRHNKNDTQLLVRCTNCGYEAWKSRAFIRAKALCPECEKGIRYHNSQGYQHERLYERYMRIISRINSHIEYRDIEMCDEWLNDYTKFREWSLNNGYSDELQIDRIDNTKGYSPDNCRWVTVKENQNNRRSNVIIEYKGVRDTIAKVAELFGKDRQLIYGRLKAGWSVEDAFEKEVDRSKWSNDRKHKHRVYINRQAEAIH